MPRRLQDALPLALGAVAASAAALAATGAAPPAPRPDGDAASPAAAIRILALGDSYTIGEGVEAGQRWPVRLAALLRGPRQEVQEPAIVARTGWTTSDLAAALDASPPAGRFDLVTLLIGVNNQYRGLAPEAYRGELRLLLARAATFAGGRPGRVVVLSIPDWGETPFAQGRDRAAISAAIGRFNAIARDEAGRAGARFVDITRVSDGMRTDAALVAPDGLHPAGALYARWAALALPEAIAALRDAGTAPKKGGA